MSDIRLHDEFIDYIATVLAIDAFLARRRAERRGEDPLKPLGHIFIDSILTPEAPQTIPNFNSSEEAYTAIGACQRRYKLARISGAINDHDYRRVSSLLEAHRTLIKAEESPDYNVCDHIEGTLGFRPPLIDDRFFEIFKDRMQQATEAVRKENEAMLDKVGAKTLRSCATLFIKYGDPIDPSEVENIFQDFFRANLPEIFSKVGAACKGIINIVFENAPNSYWGMFLNSFAQPKSGLVHTVKINTREDTPWSLPRVLILCYHELGAHLLQFDIMGQKEDLASYNKIVDLHTRPMIVIEGLASNMHLFIDKESPGWAFMKTRNEIIFLHNIALDFATFWAKQKGKTVEEAKDVYRDICGIVDQENKIIDNITDRFNDPVQMAYRACYSAGAAIVSAVVTGMEAPEERWAFLGKCCRENLWPDDLKFLLPKNFQASMKDTDPSTWSAQQWLWMAGNQLWGGLLPLPDTALDDASVRQSPCDPRQPWRCQS
jgi:hypothetical protein